MPMEDPKYVCIKITDIPEEFILEYRLAGIEDINGWIYFEICWGCYGLPQAGILANNHLRGRLEEESYYKAHSTPGLWQHKWRPVQFCLIVDNFGIEYIGIEHFNHLLALLKNTTKSKPTWRATRLQASMSNGTFRAGGHTLTCEPTLTTYYSPSTGPSQENLSYHPSLQYLSRTATKHSSRLMKTHQPQSHPNAFCAYRRSSGCSYTMQEQWTTSC